MYSLHLHCHDEHCYWCRGWNHGNTLGCGNNVIGWPRIEWSGSQQESANGNIYGMQLRLFLISCSDAIQPRFIVASVICRVAYYGRTCFILWVQIWTLGTYISKGILSWMLCVQRYGFETILVASIERAQTS
jgi:hypothetical protein